MSGLFVEKGDEAVVIVVIAVLTRDTEFRVPCHGLGLEQATLLSLFEDWILWLLIENKSFACLPLM